MDQLFPVHIYLGTSATSFPINWVQARKNSKFMARFGDRGDSTTLPTHILMDRPAAEFQTSNFRQVWNLLNGCGYKVPYNRYWVDFFQVDFFVLVRVFCVPGELAMNATATTPVLEYNVFKNPSPDQMRLLERWWQLNQQGIMYSLNNDEDEHPNDVDYEAMDRMLKVNGAAGTTATPDDTRYIFTINFLRQ